MQNRTQPEFNMSKAFPIVIVAISIILLIIFWNRMTVTIPAGNRGVTFYTFSGGIKLDEPALGEGFHFIAPWNKVYVYSVRQHHKAEEMKVLSSNGLEITVDVSVWYFPLSNKLPDLHKFLGIDYDEQVVIPALRSASRTVIGRYTPEEIYSTKKEAIQTEIFNETKNILTTKYIHVDKVLIRSIYLPETIKTAIESKLKQEQLALEYQYKLEREQKEAERKRIAAEGEAKANQIINSSLTDNLLKMRGIEATTTLSQSANSKVIVIGGGKDGLPLILNGN
ncbi:MAG: prohibitin family protein [Bacteroidales bacterium]|nr:prohibitin family protein [Bacteroidales bacterium]